MTPLLVSHFTATSCLGHGLGAMVAALREGRGGLAPCRFSDVALDTYVGEVEQVDAVRLPPALSAYDCRNNRLAELTLAQDGFAEAVSSLVARYGTRRIGVFAGTSTGGVLETELAYRRRDTLTGALPAGFEYAKAHSSFSLAAYLRKRFGLQGPALAISSACSSGAKVFVSARRMIEAGVIDAALVGGVDSLCHTTLYGFSSLELVSRQACRPYDVHRDGISIGEAGAFALLERPTAHDAALPGDAILLLGIGESSDAHHMSAPHPEGLGARLAMAQALASAGLPAGELDYVNLHGTATRSNDAAEGRAMLDLLPRTPCSSTKGATGHTLGAAGTVEAVACALALRHGLLPGSANTTELDPALPLAYLLRSRSAPLRFALSNAFGFGGTNCSLLFGRADAVVGGHP